MADDDVDLSELDCQLFIDGAPGVEELVESLADVTGGRPGGRTVEAPGLDLFVDENDDADPSAKSDRRRGFLYFDHLAEVYFAAPSVDHDARVREVAGLLEGLWTQRLAAVAACDYEDELPKRGGIDGSAPWPADG